MGKAKRLFRWSLEGAIALTICAAAMTSVSAAPAHAQRGPAFGCPDRNVCIYAGASWTNVSLRYYNYGVHRFSNLYGVHRVYNHQSGGAHAILCHNSNGTDCDYDLPAERWVDLNFTDLNSIVLTR